MDGMLTALLFTEREHSLELLEFQYTSATNFLFKHKNNQILENFELSLITLKKPLLRMHILPFFPGYLLDIFKTKYFFCFFFRDKKNRMIMFQISWPP